MTHVIIPILFDEFVYLFPLFRTSKSPTKQVFRLSYLVIIHLLVLRPPFSYLSFFFVQSGVISCRLSPISMLYIIRALKIICLNAVIKTSIFFFIHTTDVFMNHSFPRILEGCYSQPHDFFPSLSLTLFSSSPYQDTSPQIVNIC